MDGDQSAGHWSWNVSENTWLWNDRMYALYGCLPGTVVPGVELLVERTAEQDRAGARSRLTRLREDGIPFAAADHVRSADGVGAIVATVGRRAPGDPDVRIGLAIPLGSATHAPAVDPAVARIRNLETALASRDVIGQAKGVLRARQGVGDRAAFEMLRWLSQTTNTRLTVVAQRLMQWTERWPGDTDETRHEFARGLMTFADSLRGTRTPQQSTAVSSRPD